MRPPNLDESQQTLYNAIANTRIKILSKDDLFDEDGGLRGPWNAEIVSPVIGTHLEKFASAVRYDNSLEPRLYEIAILVVGAYWKSQFEWYAHEKIARKAGLAESAFPLIRSLSPVTELYGILKEDECAVYELSLELVKTKRVSTETYQKTKAFFGNSGPVADQKMTDLCMTMGCYHAVSSILNMFEVPLPSGVEPPFPEEKKTA